MEQTMTSRLPRWASDSQALLRWLQLFSLCFCRTGRRPEPPATTDWARPDSHSPEGGS